MTDANKTGLNGTVHLRTQSDEWNRKYKLPYPDNHVWGDDPSLTVQTLLEILPEIQEQHLQKILEVGFGYGRDFPVLLKKGYHIDGIEEALEGINEAVNHLNRLGFGRDPDITFHRGSFKKKIINIIDGDIHAISSHRMLHLLTEEEDIENFVEHSARVLETGGYLCISARDYRDFKDDEMEWIDKEKGIARYTIPGREGHTISFWDEKRFQKYFGEKFEIVTFKQGEEMESITNRDTMSKFTIAIMRKKSNGIMSKLWGVSAILSHATNAAKTTIIMAYR